MKRATALLLMAFIAISLWAVPAKPGTFKTLTLRDGTTIRAQLVGDEFGHYWLGDNGHAYKKAGRENYYQEVDGKAILAKAKTLRKEENAQRAKRLPRRSGTFDDYKGKKKGLVILVNFADVAFQSDHDNALYQRIANEKSFQYDQFVGSMYDYFYAQSRGQFELTFDVVGPVTVSKTQAYYGQPSDQSGNGNDQHPAEMVIEACLLADSLVNFADYDWDGDSVVDQVYVIYAEKGQASGGGEDTIWPHAWSLSGAQYNKDGTGPLNLDGVWINTYACSNELSSSGEITGIGTICHEFSHCLGFPDFYDIDYSGGIGMSSWDLMSSGNYNGNGFRPAGYTGYERWMAGWLTPIELTEETAVNNMKALENGGDTYIIYNEGNRDEYFMLDNRQQTGWDTGIPGSGMLIVHVDFDQNIWNENKANDDPNHQRMTWIPADGEYQTSYQGLSTDTYPSGSNNSFTNTSTPAAKLWNQNTDGSYLLNKSVTDITQNSNGSISFKFKNGATEVVPPENSILFADAEVKRICVKNWDTNGDGELSEEEAAAITDIGKVFRSNTSIKTFNELKYFTGLKEIGYYAFSDCKNLKKITFPDSIETIMSRAFENCESLTDLQLPESLIHLLDYAFDGCNGLQTVTIPKNVYAATSTVYAKASFPNCRNLKEIKVDPENPYLTTVDGVLYLKDFTGIQQYPAGKPDLKYEIIYGARGLAGGIFAGAGNLTTIKIPESVTYLNGPVFENCTGLTELELPQSIKRFDGSAHIRGCTSITKIISHITEPTDVDERVFEVSNGVFTSATLYVPADTKAKYQAAAGWKNFQNIVEMEEAKADVKWLSYMISGGEIVGTPHNYAFNLENQGDADFTGTIYIWIQNEDEPLVSYFDYYDGGIPAHVKGSIINQNPITFDSPGIYHFWLTTDAEGHEMIEKDFENEMTWEVKPAATLTAKSYTREYGEENPEFEFTADTGGFSGEPVITCEATKESPAGTYPIVITQGSVDNNYVSYVNGTLTITKAALMAKARSYTRKQGEENPTLEIDYSGWKLNDKESVLTKKPTATTTATASSAPGTYAITVSGGEAQNYNFNYVNGTLTVTEADAIVVTAKSYTRAYGEENPVFEYTVSGGTLNGEPTIICQATKESPVGTYDIVVGKGGVTSPNVTFVNGTLTIEKAYQTLTWEQDLLDVEQYSQVELTAEGSSGLAVSYHVNDESICAVTVIGNRSYLDCFGLGETVMYAEQQGDANWWQTTKTYKTVRIVNTSGISSLTGEAGEPFDVYSISGQVVRKSATNLLGLPKGIYIVRGQRIVVK